MRLRTYVTSRLQDNWHKPHVLRYVSVSAWLKWPGWAPRQRIGRGLAVDPGVRFGGCDEQRADSRVESIVTVIAQKKESLAVRTSRSDIPSDGLPYCVLPTLPTYPTYLPKHARSFLGFLIYTHPEGFKRDRVEIWGVLELSEADRYYLNSCCLFKSLARWIPAPIQPRPSSARFGKWEVAL